MKVIQHLAEGKDKSLISFEILPPPKGGSMQSIYKAIDPLMEFKPSFVDVTYHRQEFIYKKKASGFYEKTAIRKRPGTVGICAAIQNHYNIDAIPHLICGGFTKEDTENALIDLNFLGIDNVLALRGDPRQFEHRFIPEPDGHRYAIDLVKQIVAMNKGQYLDDNIENGEKTEFCIGVAGYPEKHFESPNFDDDLKRTKEKVDAGGEYLVTQMFFDNKVYKDYVDLCRKAKIDVPIIPGIKPITRKYQINSLPRRFYVSLPGDLVSELLKAKNADAILDVGIEWCVHQCKELIKMGVPCLHFYTMGDSTTMVRILKQLF